MNAIAKHVFLSYETAMLEMKAIGSSEIMYTLMPVETRLSFFFRMEKFPQGLFYLEQNVLCTV